MVSAERLGPTLNGSSSASSTMEVRSGGFILLTRLGRVSGGEGGGGRR